MPFHAQCSYCGQKSRAPDHMLGASGQCPRCGSFFTLVPAEEALVPGSVLPSGGLPNPLPSASVSRSEAVPRPERAEEDENAPAPPKQVPQPRDLAPADRAETATQPWVEPIGASAVFVGGAALFCAFSYTLAVAVIWLSLVSLLLGLLSVLRVMTEGKFHLLCPVAGTTMGSLILLMCLLSPSLLGPTYLAARSKAHVDPTLIRAIPLSGKPGSEPESADWVDAARFALQQGRTRLQVVAVTISPVETKPVPKKKAPLEERLFVRLRKQQILEGNDSSQPGALGDEKARPRLTDNTGKEYLEKDARIVSPEETGRKSFPTAMTDQVYEYEVPSASAAFLRLEVPASGGDMFFRFTIPNDMIRRDQPGQLPVGGLGRSGGTR